MKMIKKYLDWVMPDAGEEFGYQSSHPFCVLDFRTEASPPFTTEPPAAPECQAQSFGSLTEVAPTRPNLETSNSCPFTSFQRTRDWHSPTP